MPPADTFSLPRARQLAGLADAAHIPHDVARMACVELGRACDEVERLGAELAVARATATRLHRRAQAAEAIADRCVAGRPVTGPGLGRALANYAASRLAEVAREALDADTDDTARARLRATLATLTGEGRATLPAMSIPTLDAFTAAFYQAMIHTPDPEKVPRWEALTPAEQAARREQAKGALLYIGAPYEASPGSPPPTEPAP